MTAQLSFTYTKNSNFFRTATSFFNTVNTAYRYVLAMQIPRGGNFFKTKNIYFTTTHYFVNYSQPPN